MYPRPSAEQNIAVSSHYINTFFFPLNYICVNNIVHYMITFVRIILFFYIKLWPVSVSKDLRSVTARVIGSTFHVNKHYLVRI